MLLATSSGLKVNHDLWVKVAYQLQTFIFFVELWSLPIGNFKQSDSRHDRPAMT